ncbi:ATP-binding protein [Sphingomonas sp. 22R3R2A-7]|uniref:ATP-binding protein n=1 Tax=Sphingomonas sp. 22R3R2A-7 TaxID=3050230 RepID=UPI002FE176D3
MLNLVMNARDASANGGTISIDVVQKELLARTDVVISVTDRGEGMSEATRARAFEPRFTTKQGGRGTGYGLAMVHQFMRTSGGTAEIHSQFGSGTSVALRFPAASVAR